MAPPLGPPPYTQEQISAMTSNEEKLRARAELSSYIVRMKREKQEREANNAQYSSSHSPRGNNFTAGGHSHHTADGFRGGNNYRGHYVPRGRGYRHYHPYGRSQNQRGPYNFQHNSVSFNQAVSLDKLPQSDTSSVGASHALIDTHSKQSSQPQTGSKTLCAALTSTGKCSRPGCPHIHDANKQALCKKWLFKDDCRNGDYCLLSHKPSPNNSPTCLHFESGLCTKESCRFAHIHLNPAALNCDSFGRLGYCEKGEDCAEFHAYECPTFSNTGSCPLGDKCTLRHVLRADRLRNGGRRSPVETPSKDIKVEDDVHENGHDIIITKREEDTQDSHSISQQADFVPFGPED